MAEKKLHGLLKASWHGLLEFACSFSLQFVSSHFAFNSRPTTFMLHSQDKRQLHQLWRKMAAGMQTRDGFWRVCLNLLACQTCVCVCVCVCVWVGGGLCVCVCVLVVCVCVCLCVCL